MAKIQVTVETIGPKKAEQYINENTCNRSLREGVVDQYSKDMKAGNWTQCTAPIAFYKDGGLADGQHRLYAIVESGTTQTFTVMRGLDREDGLNIDTGLARTVVDNGRISGMDQELSNNLVATARAVALGQPSAGRMSNAEKLALVEEHREACSWAIGVLPHVKNIFNTVVLGAMARAYNHEEDLERLGQFAQVVATGFSQGDADSAAVAMRNYMLLHAGKAAGSAMWRDSFLKAQNAIQYFMNRRKLTYIKVVKDEAYPLRAKKRSMHKLAKAA